MGPLLSPAAPPAAAFFPSIARRGGQRQVRADAGRESLPEVYKRPRRILRFSPRDSAQSFFREPPGFGKSHEIRRRSGSGGAEALTTGRRDAIISRKSAQWGLLSGLLRAFFIFSHFTPFRKTKPPHFCDSFILSLKLIYNLNLFRPPNQQLSYTLQV